MGSRLRALAALAVALAVSCGVVAAASGAGIPSGMGDSVAAEIIPERSSAAKLGRYPSASRLRAAYLGAVHLLASEGWDGGLAAVATLEMSVYEEGGAGSLAELSDAQFEIAARLVEAEPGAVLSLMRLHQLLAGRYQTRARSTLVIHAASVVERLSSLASGENGHVRRVAADILSCVAGRLAGTAVVLTARRLLEAAADLDRRNPRVAAVTAELDESLGRYRDATAELGRLTGWEPNDLKARLRLGVNLVRLGSLDDAREQLRRCTVREAPDWVRAVAFDELARVEMRERRWPEAAAILESAVAELDDRERTAIQLSYVYDRLGRPADAERTLEIIGAPRPERSARYLYAARPSPGLVAAEGYLEGLTSQWDRGLGTAVVAVMSPPAP